MQALALVQMQAFADRRASQLSGGQQQRVALARAFVFQPSVLLFDEPLSNLDAKLRADMRIELRDLQHRLGITSVYVTHDLEEALAMSDHIVVMRDGLVEQTGTPDEIYRLPRSAFVADFVGSANLVHGRNRRDLAADGLLVLETPSGQVIYGNAYGRRGGRRAHRVGAHRASADFAATARWRSQRVAGARREDGFPGRLYPGAHPLGRSAAHRPLRGARSAAGRARGVHHRRSEAGGAAWYVTWRVTWRVIWRVTRRANDAARSARSCCRTDPARAGARSLRSARLHPRPCSRRARLSRQCHAGRRR